MRVALWQRTCGTILSLVFGTQESPLTLNQKSPRPASKDRSRKSKGNPSPLDTSQTASERLKPRQSRSWYLGLFLAVLIIYAFTLTDVDFNRIIDGQVMFETAVSLHEFGELGISPEFDGHGGRAGISDHYGKYGLGLSFVQQIPLFFVPLMERTFGNGSSNILLAMTNVWLTALTSLLIALCARILGFRFRTGALAALAFAFSTFAWPYISYDFSEPLQEFCLIIAFWLLLRALKAPQRISASIVLSGFVLGLAVVTKANLLILVPCYAAYLWFSSYPPQRRKLFAAWMLPLVLWGIAIAIINFHRFGSIFDMGYGPETRDFNTPLFEGLYGLLLGPNKGLIFYAPLTLLFPWALLRFSKSYRREAFFFLSVFVLHTVVNAMWWSWEGGESWGTRMLLPILPMVILCTATLLEEVRWSIVPFAACFIAGFAVNLLGLLLYFQVWPVVVKLNNLRIPMDIRGRPASEYIIQNGKKWFRPSIATYYLPALSPLRGHAWLLRERYQGKLKSSALRDQPASTSLGIVNFPPVHINFALLKEQFFLEQLSSPHFWLWDKIRQTPRSEVLSYPAYAIALQHQGDRALLFRNIPRAFYCFERATELMPNQVEPALKLSELHTQTNNLKGAEDTMVKFLAYLQNSKKPSDMEVRRPQERVAHAWLGQIYELKGDRPSAVREYRAVLALEPNDKDCAIIEKRLQELADGFPQ